MKMGITIDGRFTPCKAPEDKVGVGRCDHVSHIKPGEEIEDLLMRNEVTEHFLYNNYPGEEYSLLKPGGKKVSKSVIVDQDNNKITILKQPPRNIPEGFEIEDLTVLQPFEFDSSGNLVFESFKINFDQNTKRLTSDDIIVPQIIGKSLKDRGYEIKMSNLKSGGSYDNLIMNLKPEVKEIIKNEYEFQVPLLKSGFYNEDDSLSFLSFHKVMGHINRTARGRKGIKEDEVAEIMLKNYLLGINKNNSGIAEEFEISDSDLKFKDKDPNVRADAAFCTKNYELFVDDHDEKVKKYLRDNILFHQDLRKIKSDKVKKFLAKNIEIKDYSKMKDLNNGVSKGIIESRFVEEFNDFKFLDQIDIVKNNHNLHDNLLFNESEEIRAEISRSTSRTEILELLVNDKSNYVSTEAKNNLKNLKKIEYSRYN